MRFIKVCFLLMAVVSVLCACGKSPEKQAPVTHIVLSNEVTTVDGVPVETDETQAVYAANDIIYYEEGKDFTYGEGGDGDSHSAQLAAEHTVIHITQPGTYRVSGCLSKGQIAVDLGDGAKEDPQAIVTLLLDGVDITCQVAPAVIFYEVYECGNADTPSKDVDTSAAGANVIVADGSENTVNGAYVARIYKQDTVVLNEAGTQVEDAKKLHKYDGAFYSRMSMNVDGQKKGDGVLNIVAQNEGMDSEMHLTVNGGNINITSGNDGINTNEDGVSVTTINGGALNILVTGQTGEGDGIDSNGWLVINGGTVIASACADSADAGIDSDMGIHIYGGTVIAGGHMLDHIQDGGQTYAVFTFAQKQEGGAVLSLRDEKENAVLEHCPQNAYSVLIYSSPKLTEGSYTLWSDQQQLATQGGGMPGGFGGGMQPPEGGRPTDGMMPPEGDRPTDGMMPPEGDRPTDGMTPPEGDRPTDGMTPPEGERPTDGMQPPVGDKSQNGQGKPDNHFQTDQEQTVEFRITNGANMFSGIRPLTALEGLGEE